MGAILKYNLPNEKKNSKEKFSKLQTKTIPRDKLIRWLSPGTAGKCHKTDTFLNNENNINFFLSKGKQEQEVDPFRST